MIDIDDKFICVETLRDGEGPCSNFDGSEGCPLVHIGEIGKVVRIHSPLILKFEDNKKVTVNPEQLERFFERYYPQPSLFTRLCRSYFS